MASTTIDVTGINTNKIATIQTAITDWKKAIDAANISLASKNINAALKGSTQQNEIKKLAQAVDSYTKTLTTVLTEYNTALDSVKTAYVKNDTSSTSISSVTASINNLKS